MALLVHAWNTCYRPHFPGLPEWTVDEFKLQIRRRHVWTSSCMVADSGKETIGVLIAAKRDTENLICAVGIRIHLGPRALGTG